MFLASTVSLRKGVGPTTTYFREEHVSEALRLAADIVSAHVSNNDVAPDELPLVIRSVHDVLAGCSSRMATVSD